MNPQVIVNFAKFYATVKHAGQTYGVGIPYTHHLSEVECVIYRFGFESDYELRAAAWLHDAVEDTGTKVKEIRELFGDRIADLVSAVTNEEGKNRKERHKKTYPKIAAAGDEAVILKLADRIANVESGGSLLEMYKKEYPEFRAALCRKTGLIPLAAMWLHLDKLMNYNEK